jgi:hypothetical protein
LTGFSSVFLHASSGFMTGGTRVNWGCGMAEARGYGADCRPAVFSFLTARQTVAG